MIGYLSRLPVPAGHNRPGPAQGWASYVRFAALCPDPDGPKDCQQHSAPAQGTQRAARQPDTQHCQVPEAQSIRATEGEDLRAGRAAAGDSDVGCEFLPGQECG